MTAIPDSRSMLDARLRRLEEQLVRVRQLYEFGEYGWETFLAKRAEIRDEQERIRAEASRGGEDRDLEWCRTQLLDLVAAWDVADDAQPSRLLTGLFESIEAEALPDSRLKLVAVPRGVWRRFFELGYSTAGEIAWFLGTLPLSVVGPSQHAHIRRSAKFTPP